MSPLNNICGLKHDFFAVYNLSRKISGRTQIVDGYQKFTFDRPRGRIDVMKTASKHKILQMGTTIQAPQFAQQKVANADFLLSAEDMDLYTKQEFADLLKVTVAAASRWITQGRLRPTKVGSLTRISRAEIRRFILANNPGMEQRLTESNADQRRLDSLRKRARESFLRRRAYDQDLCEI